MIKPLIRVEIHNPGAYEFSTVVQKEVPYWIVNAKPLDLPLSANAYDGLFNTDPVRIEKVMRKRKELAKDLAQDLTEMILKLLESRDTINGYEKED